MADHISVKIPHEGYEIEVKVGVSSIIGAIERAEEQGDDQFLLHGPEGMPLSKYATVAAEPTDDKWKELADRYYDES